MTAKCFVDTNVLVHARDDSDPQKQAAARAWLGALRQMESGRISYQVVFEYYEVLTRKFHRQVARDDARDDVRNLLAWRPVAPSTGLIDAAWEAQARWQLSWWDCLILAAAQVAECDYLLSEDLATGQEYGGVRVINPFVSGPVAVLGAK